MVPGRVAFGKYLVERKLGEGGMGAVWLVQTTGLQRKSALKLIRPEIAQNEQAWRRFEREARILAKLNHPSVVTVYDYRRTRSVAYIEMEYLHGRSLDRVLTELRGRPLEPSETAPLLVQLCAGLQEVHGYMDEETRRPHPIVHRDLKPANLMLVDDRPPDRNLKILDFGIAKMTGDDVPQLTEGEFVGTVGYSSPEQIQGQELDGRSDIYSVGILLYQLLTGKLPFSGGRMTILTAHVTQSPPPMKEANPQANVPPEVERIVRKCLEKDPAKRYQSPGELAGAFLHALETSARTRRFRVRSIGWAVPLGLVAAVVLVVLLSRGRQRTAPPPSAIAGGGPSAQPPGLTPAVETAIPALGPSPKELTEIAKNPVATNKESSKPDAPSSTAVGATAARVKEVFRSHCLECHGGSKTNGGVKILDRDLLVKKEKVVPGQPDESLLFLLITAEDETGMPPPGQPRLRSGEIELIQSWIAEGASPFPPDLPAPAESKKDVALQAVVGVDHVLKAILQDVRSLPPQDRPFMRYLSLNHLLIGGATAEELDLHRDALTKTINHLTWEPRLVQPRPIESSKTVFGIDLRALGWDHRPFQVVRDEEPVGQSRVNLFDLVLLEYPYGTIYETSETFDQLASEFLAPAGQVRPIPYVRADWFVSVATQPPLYEDLLGLPVVLPQLEKRLGVDAQADLDGARPRARRAGLTVSGVSRNNRALERHPARYGAFWKSFDFRTSVAKENLFRDPIHLNPAGGEIIFNLPNGLQGYFLNNAKGDRLEAAPIEIVTDKFAADQTVRNGLSCIRCHDTGMKGFTDNVRPAVIQLPDSPGFDKARVLRLYADQTEFDAVLKEDADRFTKALRAALGRIPAREPLIPVSQRFLDAPLSLAKVAAELGWPDPAKLQPILRSPSFTSLGLASLASQGVLRRDTWESAYDEVVRRLGLGNPVIPLDGLTRRDFQPDQPEIDVELKTNKPNNTFAPGDTMVILVVNRSSKPVHIELIGTSAQGKKTLLTPGPTEIAAGKEFRFPSQGAIRIQPSIGKEQISVFASGAGFPPGVLLRGQDVADRFIHPFDALQSRDQRDAPQFDPARFLKKSVTIETR
jgi:serine/threonine-protein kinase